MNVKVVLSLLTWSASVRAAHRCQAHPDISNAFISYVRISLSRSVYPTTRSLIFSRSEAEFLQVNSAVSTPSLGPHLYLALALEVGAMNVPEVMHLNSLSEEYALIQKLLV